MHVVPVDDPGDPRLVELAGLTDAAARARLEAEHGCFVAEGLLALEAALRSPYPVRSVLVAEPKLARVEALVGGADVVVHVAPPALLQAVTGFAIHRGVLASVGRLPLPDPGYLRFRMQTAYGDTGARPPDPHDLVTYLRWCRAYPRP